MDFISENPLELINSIPILFSYTLNEIKIESKINIVSDVFTVMICDHD